MLKTLTHEISNTRFLVYVALLYILALTASTWVPESSPAYDQAVYLKLALVPFAQIFLLYGARHRWSENYTVILLASCAFLAGLAGSTFL